MDKLADLPQKNDTVRTPEEESVMKQFFAGSMPSQNSSDAQNSHPHQSSMVQNSHPHQSSMVQNSHPHQSSMVQNSPPPSLKSRLNWKLTGTVIVLFMALANPWIDSLFCKIPYCGEKSSTLLGIKVLLFAMLLIVASLYM